MPQLYFPQARASQMQACRAFHPGGGSASLHAGSVGDGYDNALAESTIGLYKAERINPQRPWKTLDEVEFATLEWVDWYNNARLHGACERLPPAEFEASHLAAQT